MTQLSTPLRSDKKVAAIAAGLVAVIEKNRQA